MFITGNAIQDQILQALSYKSLTAKELGSVVSVSIQSIHKVLRKLVNAEVVLKHNVNYSLNQEWVAGNFNKLSNSDFINLSPEEHFKHTFNNFKHLERFWKHTLTPLITKSDQVFIYNPHWIWWYIPDNFQSEANFVNSFNKSHRCYLMIGSNTVEDQSIRRLWQDDFFRISLNTDSSLSKKEFYTVINNLVITTTLPLAVIKQIDTHYQSSQVGKNLAKSLEPVLTRTVNKIILSVENNQNKANKLRKIISQDFVL